jgi:hypothetical protein
MGIGKSHDFPPILPPGRHVMTLEQIKALCVDAFSNRARRSELFHHFEELVQSFLVGGIPCEIWLDGSFLTEKEAPRDLDVTVIIEADVATNLSADQQKLVDIAGEGRFNDAVDSFVFSRLPREDPNFGDDLADPAYSWGEQYGRETSEQWLKGFVVMMLRETNVGLRLRS